MVAVVLSVCPSTSAAAKVDRHPQICHPERSGPEISCYAAVTNARVCGFSKESRMKFANATKFDGKSGVA